MLVVAAALCCATFNMLFLAIILTMALLALYCIRFSGSFLNLSQNNGMLVISVPDETYSKVQKQIADTLDLFLKVKRLDSLVEENGQVTLSFNILSVQEKEVLSLQQALHTVTPEIVTNVYRNSAVI